MKINILISKTLKCLYVAGQTVLLLTIFFSSSSVLAAINDNISGILQRELELQFKKYTPSPQPPVIEKKADEVPAPVAPGVTTVTIQDFRFTGNQLLSNEELQTIINKWKNKSLQFSDLKNVTTEIQDYYASKNRIARAVLPEQEITNGIVTIRIIEGTLGEIIVENKSATPRMSANVVKKYFEIKNNKNEVIYVDTKDIQKTVALLNELPGIRAAASYEQGKTEGETNLKISIEDTPLFTSEVALANYGSRSTGSDQAIANITMNNISGRGDLAMINAMRSTGSTYVQGSYSVPVGITGMQVGLQASNLDYKTSYSFSGDNQSEGDAKTVGINLSYPVLRSERGSTNAKISIDNKEYLNTLVSDGTTLSDYKITNIVASLSGYLLNKDKSTISYSSSITFGDLNINDTTQAATDSTTAKTNGSFEKFNFSLSRNETIASLKNSNWVISADGQLASKNLNSSEQLSLGGPYAVRAYPSGQSSGSQGFILRTELQYPYNDKFTVGPFADIGFIQQYVNTYTDWKGLTNADNEYHLASAGIAGTYKMDNTDISGVLAYRIGDNPLHTSTGEQLNSDNNYSRIQAWIKISSKF